MNDPVLTRDMVADKMLIDLTKQDAGDLLIEAHEMASYAYDLVNEILEVK
jgi:hypothetical protein